MTMDFAVPLITGFFVGGIVTEVRWVLRLRQLEGEIGIQHSAELLQAAGVVRTEAQRTPEEQSSPGLRLLHDHLAAEGGATPVIEPATAGTRDA